MACNCMPRKSGYPKCHLRSFTSDSLLHEDGTFFLLLLFALASFNGNGDFVCIFDSDLRKRSVVQRIECEFERGMRSAEFFFLSKRRVSSRVCTMHSAKAIPFAGFLVFYLPRRIGIVKLKKLGWALYKKMGKAQVCVSCCC